jgi:hypothetical protein
MMAHEPFSDVTVAFADLITFGELESRYMYNAPDQPTKSCFFIRETRRSVWFAQFPCNMNRITGRAAFGHTFSVKVSRTGDYLTHAWIAFELPTVKLHPAEYQWGGPDAYTEILMGNKVYLEDLRADLPDVIRKNPDGTFTVRMKGAVLYRWFGPSARIRWCKNLAHNLIDAVKFTVNDLPMCQVDAQWLDFWSEFMLPGEKRQSYSEMIGNTERWTDPMRFYNRMRTDLAYDDARNGIAAPGGKLQLPIPLPFNRDYGTCLPCASIPYNEIRVHTTLANWTSVLVVDYPYGCSFGGNDRGTYFSLEQATARGRMMQECLHVMWLNRYTPSPDYITGYLAKFHPISTEETTTTQTVKTTSVVQTQKTTFYFLSDVNGDTSTTTVVGTGGGGGGGAATNTTSTTSSSSSFSSAGTTTKVQSIENAAMMAQTIDLANRKRRADIIAFLTQLRLIVEKNQVSQSLSPFYLTQWNDFATNLNRDLPSDRRIAVFTVETLNRPVQQQPRISDLADVLELGNPNDSMLFRLTPENGRAVCFDGADYTFFVNESLTSPEIVAALKSNKYKYLSMHLDYADTGVSYEDGIYRIQYTGNQVVLSFRYVPVVAKFNARRYYGYAANSTLVSVRNGNINPPPRIVHLFNNPMFTYAHCELVIRLTGNMPLSAYVDTAVSTFVTTQTTQLIQNGASIYRQRIASIIAMRMLLDPTCLLFPFLANMAAVVDDDWQLLEDDLRYWTGWMWSYHYKRHKPPPTALVRLVEAFACSRSCAPSALVAVPEIISASWWFNYAIVHSHERQRMGLERRVCVCEWMQRADDGSVRADSPTTSVNLFFKNAVRALFFCARNESIPAERSHYDARNMLVSWDGVGLPSPSVPIVRTLSIFYGKVGKFEKMPLDHFSLVEPYLHGNRSGVTPGLAMLSFANDIRTPPPNGHINFSNLAEVSVQFEETTEVTRIKDGGVLSPADLTPMTTPTTTTTTQTTPTTTDAPPALDRRPPFPPNWRYTCAVYALTNNIIEISRGTIKFLF